MNDHTNALWRLPQVTAIVTCVLLVGCDGKNASTPDIRPVRTVTIQPGYGTELLSVTGEIKARYESDLSFRIDGKIVERPVDIGSTVKKGDLLARLDPQPRQQDLAAAKANAAAAQARLVRDRGTEARQLKLLQAGYATQAAYDAALANLRSDEAEVESTTARLRQAEDNLGYARLVADADGIVTQVYGNAGQVVPAGQAVVHLAQPGEREAVFHVSESILSTSPKSPPVTVTLTSNPTTKVMGTVRYVSPQADAATRTYEVRISLPDAPEEMRLGATVKGSVSLDKPDTVELPGSALVEEKSQPAVWLVDTRTSAVSLQPVSISRYSADKVILSEGLKQGDVIVTAGVQTLIPGQKVRLLDGVTP